MNWSDDLARIRYFLRDPGGGIWSDAFLRHLYNDVQQDFQHKTQALEGVVAQRVPGVYDFAFLYDWEWRHLPVGQSQFYQALSLHDDGVCCHRWEPQQVTGIDADVSDYGAHFTQPWEAFMGMTPADPVRMRFPADFGSVRFIAYDDQPIDAMTRKGIASADPSYITREGLPIGYYVHDQADNSYVLYPRPSTAFVNELSGDGLAFFAEDDTEDVTTGLIAVRADSVDLTQGASVDIVSTSSNVFMVYESSPADMVSAADESDFPVYLRKYIRAGVIARAYAGNNDGRIRSLGEYWGMRYTLGVEYTKRWRRNRRQDRDYRLTTRGAPPRRTYRHPRLPDGYPAT
jgi:hypothetical protein